MSSPETNTTDLLDRAMTQEAERFIKRIQALENDELFHFARIIGSVKIPVDQHDTSIGEVFYAARNMTVLDDVQQVIYSFND